MNAKAVERLSLESRLRQAVANDELELHFQPFIDLRTAELLGAEALIRWRHPELGLIPPGDFIPIAELSGLIVPIGEWVLRTACAEARKWHKKGFGRLTVSVNLSSRQFQQTDLVSQVTQRPRGDGPRGRQARPRDHRVQRDAERRALDQHALGPEEAGRAHLDGRLRNRLLVAQLPEALPHRPHQARPVLRARPARATRTTRRSPWPSSRWAAASSSSSSPRASRPRSSSRSSRATSATSSRASCSRARSRPEAFDRFLDDSRDADVTQERSRFARAH